MNEPSSLYPSVPPADARMWALFCHLAAFAGYLIPFGHLIGPLVIWLIKKNEMPFVDDQGKEALNFQITMTLAALVSLVLIFFVVGFFLLVAVVVVDVVFIIVAAVKANEGVAYRYPLSIRFLR